MLSLRVATGRRRADRDRRGPAPRGRPGAHAAVRRLGGHARDHHPRDAEIVPLPAAAALRHAVAFPSVDAGDRAPSGRTLHARPPPVGDPHVRRGGDAADVRPGRRRGPDGRLHRRSCFEGEAAAAELEERPHAGESRAEAGARDARSRARPSAGGTAATTSTSRPTTPSCPSIWGTIDVVATYSRIDGVLRRAARPRSASRYRRHAASSCGCTSRTGTAGGR